MKKAFCLFAMLQALLLVAVPITSTADSAYPFRPIKLVVAGPPGGMPDVVARLLGNYLTAALDQPAVVENKTGAGGIIALDSVAKAKADGYTLLVSDSSPLTINPTIFKRLPYNGIADFEPIALIGSGPLFLAAGPSLQAATFEELVAQAKAHPGKLTYGTVGVGSLHHIAFEEMSRLAGIQLMHVPFREQPAAPVAAGQVDMLLAGLPSIDGLVRSGHLHLLGATSKARFSTLRDTPTLSESGIPSYAFTADIGLLAPKGTPPEALAKLSDAVHTMLNEPEARQKLVELGMVPGDRLLTDYGSYMAGEISRFKAMVEQAGLAGTQ